MEDCKYCNGEEYLRKRIESGIVDMWVDVDNDLCIERDTGLKYSDMDFDSYVEINYCPMCGRKLK